jgi:predicted nucleic acid-binding protein
MGIEVIIDANVLAEFFKESSPYSQLNQKVIRDRLLPIVLGGSKLRQEYARLQRLRSLIFELLSAGIIQTADDEAVDEEAQRLVDTECCQSNDHHVIALARCSRGRVLCSCDKALQGDFLDAALVSQPRGFIYGCDKHLEPMIKKYHLR